MNRNDVIRLAQAKGLTVEPCNLESLIAIRKSKVPDGCNERMRMTADGAFYTVADGYYWQVGTVEDVFNYVQTL